VSREQVRVHCLDAEDGREGDVRISYLRYDTAIKAAIAVDRDAGTIAYGYDDGPGALDGESRGKFLDWLVALAPWEVATRAPVAAAVEAAEVDSPAAADVVSLPGLPGLSGLPGLPALGGKRTTSPMPAPSENVWSRPMGPSRSV
jgi:hypothetical protein